MDRRSTNPYAMPGSYGGESNGRYSQSTRSYRAVICRLEGCEKPAAYPHTYCVVNHARLAVIRRQVEGCANCHELPVNDPFEFCSRSCGIKAQQARRGVDSTLTSYRPTFSTRHSALSTASRSRAPPDPEEVDLIDLQDALGASQDKDSNPFASQPVSEQQPSAPPTAAPSNNLPDPAKRWTYHYHPCHCAATTSMEHAPTLYRCPICGGQCSPKFVEHLGIVTSYDPGRNSSTARGARNLQNLTVPIPSSHRLSSTGNGQSGAVAFPVNTRPIFRIPDSPLKSPSQQNRLPSAVDHPSPISPFTETSTPRNDRRASLSTVRVAITSNVPASGHPDLKIAVGRQGSVDSDRPPFSRQASITEAPPQAVGSESASLNPFRNEPYSALSEVNDEWVDMGMDIDPKTPVTEVPGETSSTLSIDRLTVKDASSAERASSDTSSFCELPDRSPQSGLDAPAGTSSEQERDWTLDLNGKVKGKAHRSDSSVLSDAFTKANHRPEEVAAPSTSLLLRKVGPRDPPWKISRPELGHARAGGPETSIIPEGQRSPRLKETITHAAQDEIPQHPDVQADSPTTRPSPPTKFSGKLLLREQEGAPYFSLTNPAKSTVQYDNRIYPSAEHLFHALKFLSVRPNLAEHIRICGGMPGEEATRFKFEHRPDWSDVCITMMHEILQLKFDQHVDLKEELLDTGEKELILISQDDLWGDGGNGNGRNEFGKALMSTRAFYLRDY